MIGINDRPSTAGCGLLGLLQNITIMLLNEVVFKEKWQSPILPILGQAKNEGIGKAAQSSRVIIYNHF